MIAVYAPGRRFPAGPLTTADPRAFEQLPGPGLSPAAHQRDRATSAGIRLPVAVVGQTRPVRKTKAAALLPTGRPLGTEGTARLDQHR